MELFRYSGVTGMQELTRNPLKPAESCMAVRGTSRGWGEWWGRERCSGLSWHGPRLWGWGTHGAPISNNIPHSPGFAKAFAI